jgi:CRP-like cAMP-binding protein
MLTIFDKTVPTPTDSRSNDMPRGTSSGSRGFLGTRFPVRKVLQFKTGETIVAQGDECTDVHYIQEGVVKLTVVSHRGRAAVLGLLGEGDFFGEACIAGQSMYSISAIALVPCTIGVVRRKTMMRLLADDPSVSARFMNYLLMRNQHIEQALVDRLLNSSEKRLARTLLLLARYRDGGKVTPIMDKISQDMLAEMVGTTRSRINFFMNKFRKLGFIHYNGGITIHQSLASILQD